VEGRCIRSIIPAYGYTRGYSALPIAVVTTGGTIDKLYFDSLSEYQVGESVVRKLLTIGKREISLRDYRSTAKGQSRADGSGSR